MCDVDKVKESNPGPTYSILKVVKASHHQGDQRYEGTSGNQCACNALYSIVWSFLRNIALWNTFDLDHILFNGDLVYKKLNVSRSLFISDLPNQIDTDKGSFSIKMLGNKTGFLAYDNRSNFMKTLLEKEVIGDGLLFMTLGYTFSILCNKRNYFIFDSHSRGSEGTAVENGNSVLLKFSSLRQLQIYIYEVYFLMQNSNFLQFEVQFISLEKNDFEIVNAACPVARSMRQACSMKRNSNPDIYEQKKQSDRQRKNALLKNIKGTETHKQIKAFDRQRKNIQLVNIKGTEAHEQIKAYDCQRKNIQLENIKGTEAHEQIKAYDRQRKNIQLKNIKGTEAHERIKAYDNQRKNIQLENIKGTEAHKQIKAFRCQRKRIQFEIIKGTEVHEQMKALDRQRKNIQLENIKGTEIHEQKKARDRKRKSNESFNIIGTVEHEVIKKKKKTNTQINRQRTTATLRNVSSEEMINRFHSKIKQGPYYICVCCERGHYKGSTLLYKPDKYQILVEDYTTLTATYDSEHYICKTCHTKLKKGKTPCQAVWNKLEVDPLPNVLESLHRLEKAIICRRMLFSKVMIMPKGQMPKIKGCICNVPIDVSEINNILPRGADSNGLISVKLKRKLAYRGHVYFEPVRPENVQHALEFLKANNPLYQDVVIAINQIPSELILPSDNVDHNQILEVREDDLEEVENPLDELRVGSTETVLISNIPYSVEQENVIIAPGENKKPLSTMMDKNCEELAFPYLLPKGKFGFNVERDVPLSASKYFNQRLLNYTQRFAGTSDYIFFAHSVLQQMQLTSNINMTMKKVQTNNLTAGMLSGNFQETVKSFIAKDEGYNFMNTIKGTPAYWKRFLFEVLAMVKQLGLPTFFMTLSCADLRWNELVEIITKLGGKYISEEDIENLSYFERCAILNMNPVLLAKHFQYRVEVFFKEIVVDGPLGKVTYHAIRVEFQFRGSPHIHSFLWILNSPKLTKETKDEYIAFVDGIVKADIPDPVNKPKLHKMVKTFQLHSHSKSCRKYKNIPCRYSFGKFFSNKTIVAEPLSQELSEEEKSSKLQQRQNVLDKVKDYIDVYLDPRKNNFLNSSADNYHELHDIPTILQSIGLNETEYYNALSISSDNDFQIHLRRPPNSCFINNYFEEGLMAWEANIDIQPVMNHYKAVTYMCAYFSKSEDETSEAMKQAAKEATTCGKSKLELMKSIARAYVTKRECSVQEAVYHVMPELWLRKTFPAVIFANSNLPEDRYRMFRSEKEIQELPRDSTDVYKRNNIDRYMARPNTTFQNGKYTQINNMCHAEFLSRYYLRPKPNDDNVNDNQPEVLSEEVMDENNAACSYPKIIPLMSSKEKLQCRKVRAVLRYHEPNPEKFPEKYAHHLLFMFYPFHKESDLKSLSTGFYIDKLNEPNVLDVINVNKKKFEPFADIVDSALRNLRTNSQHNLDSFAQQENDEVHQILEATDTLIDDDPEDDPEIFSDMDVSHPIRSTLLNDDELNEKIRSLNSQQRTIFDVVNKWSRDYVKNLSSKSPIKIEPIHIFLTGKGGCGKSHLIRAITDSISKTLSYHAKDPEKCRVQNCAPTGIAACKVDGNTIHSELGIPVGNFSKTIPKLGDKMRSSLRNKLSELRLLIIDEVSMVSNKMLLYIHQRLVEIFGCSPDIPFAGISIIFSGDFFQLPPIKAYPIYAPYELSSWENLVHKWKLFRLAELDIVMRQRGDENFIDLLNKVRIAEIDDECERILRLKFISKEDTNYPTNALHIFAENKPVIRHNNLMLSLLENVFFSINAIDKYPKNISQSAINKIMNRNQTETGGLAAKLDLKKHSRVMLTSNVCVNDRLSNGQLGTVKKLTINNQNEVEKIYVKFDDSHVGVNAICNDSFGKQHSWVPIERVEASIKINSNKASSPTIRRTQFPLMLAWACTVHKVQGQTLDEVVVSFDLENQRSFNNGQIYVALSRVTSLNGLHLVGTYKSSAIKADEKAKTEYERLRNESLLKLTPDCSQMNQHSLTITLLNTRSLSKHAIDISFDQSLIENDVLCLTETQLLPEQGTSEIETALNTFDFTYNTSIDKFQSLAIGHHRSVTILNHLKSQGISLLNIEKSTFFKCPLSLLLLYRKQSWSVPSFIDALSQLLYGPIDIILGDFNIDSFDMPESLNTVLNNFELVVKGPTHLSGSQLDHVYVNKTLLLQINMEAVIRTVYFSDHEAVKVKLSNKFI